MRITRNIRVGDYFKIKIKSTGKNQLAKVIGIYGQNRVCVKYSNSQQVTLSPMVNEFYRITKDEYQHAWLSNTESLKPPAPRKSKSSKKKDAKKKTTKKTTKKKSRKKKATA